MTPDNRLVGAARQRLASELERAFDGALREGAPLFITLTAAPGWGKTALVHEFYRRLAAGEDATYWPEVISEPGSIGPDRKRVNPDYSEVRPGGGMPWMWWGIAASGRRSSPAMSSLARDLEWLQLHETGLREATTGRRSTGDRVRQWIKSDEAREISAAGRDEVLGLALDAAGLAVPGLSLVVTSAKLLRRRHAERTAADAVPSVSDVAQELATSVHESADAGLPVVIFVEDLHEADDLLLEFLSRSLCRRGPVVVVATCLPGEESEAVLSRLSLAVTGPGRHIPIVTVDSPDLNLTDRLSLLERLVPESDPVIGREFAFRYGTPLAVHLALSLPRVRRALETGNTSELTRQPTRLSRLYEAAWDELPAHVRTALMVAALTTQDESGVASHFDREVVAGTLVTLGLVDSGAIAASVVQDGHAYGWAAKVDDWISVFRPPLGRSIAAEAASDFFSETQRNRIRTAAARTAMASESVADGITRAQLITHLAMEGLIEWDKETRSAAGKVLRELAIIRDVRSDETYMRLSDQVVDSFGDSQVGIDTRLMRANIAHDRGDKDLELTELQFVADTYGVLAEKWPSLRELFGSSAITDRHRGVGERVIELDGLQLFAAYDRLAFLHMEAGQVDKARSAAGVLQRLAMDPLNDEDKRQYAERVAAAAAAGWTGFLDGYGIVVDAHNALHQGRPQDADLLFQEWARNVEVPATPDEAEEQMPHRVIAMAVRIEVAVSDAELTEPLEQLMAVLAVAEPTAEMLNGLFVAAHTFEILGDWAAAISAIERAVEHAPSLLQVGNRFRLEAYWALGRAYWHAGKLDQAQETFNAGLVEARRAQYDEELVGCITLGCGALLHDRGLDGGSRLREARTILSRADPEHPYLVEVEKRLG